MLFRKQLSYHDPVNGRIGDCLRTCYACILNLEPSEVPHFLELHWNDGDPDLVSIAKEIDAFLAIRGLARFDVVYPGDVPFQDIAEHIYNINGDITYLVGGASPHGGGHSVIYKGKSMLWDPAPANRGIVGPLKDGHYWVTILTPHFVVE